jgi:hypothetical protein
VQGDSSRYCPHEVICVKVSDWWQIKRASRKLFLNNNSNFIQAIETEGLNTSWHRSNAAERKCMNCLLEWKRHNTHSIIYEWRNGICSLQVKARSQCHLCWRNASISHQMWATVKYRCLYISSLTGSSEINTCMSHTGSFEIDACISYHIQVVLK